MSQQRGLNTNRILHHAEPMSSESRAGNGQPVRLGLRDFREHLGLSLAEFARRLGVSSSLVCRIELGREQAYPKFRRRAAEVLGIPEGIIWRLGDGPAREGRPKGPASPGRRS
jgi:DNA-binding XRE family transcriptional regulator